MWLWWILTLVILTICVIFAIRIFTTSRKLHREVLFGDETRHKPINRSPKSLFFNADPQEQAILSLKARLQEVMSNSDRYLDQVNKLTQRMESLETGKRLPVRKDSQDDEDWEELYYQASQQKEKLENELDLTQQTLDKAEERINKLEKAELAHIELQSEFEEQLNNAQSFQNKINELERKLEGAAERERDLQFQIEQELAEKELHELLKHEHTALQTETDELKRTLQELTKRNLLSSQKINRLHELESTFEIAEYEKSDLRKTVEDIIMENEALSLKLQELQDKLGNEKYA